MEGTPLPLLHPLCLPCSPLCPHRPPAMRTPRRRAMGCPMACPPPALTGRGRRDTGTSAVLLPPSTPCRKPPSDAPTMGVMATPLLRGFRPWCGIHRQPGEPKNRRDTGGLPLQGALGPRLRGCWSSAPLSRLGHCLVPPAQPRALHTAPGLEAARTPQGAPATPVTCLCVWCPPNKWFWSTGVGGSQGAAPLYPGTPQLPRSSGLSLLLPGGARNPCHPGCEWDAPFFQSVGSPRSHRTAVSPGAAVSSGTGLAPVSHVGPRTPGAPGPFPRKRRAGPGGSGGPGLHGRVRVPAPPAFPG